MTTPDTTPGALAGIKVIDLTRVLGGPFCTQWLADHGATVIKIEPPQGDETRGWGPPFQDGTASYFIGVNRNKYGLALDLARPEGREVLLRLLTDADVLIENFKPGTLEKWGIGYEEFLQAQYPRLIHCRVSGFGADGPLGGLPGYDAAIQASAGLMSVNGEAGGGALKLGIPIVDLGTGLSAAIGILMALVERSRSQLGQFIDVTLYDTAVSLLHPQAANWLMGGKIPGPLGNAHPNITPYDKFTTATGDIFLAVGNNGQFRKLCTLLEQPDLADDPRFGSNAERNRHQAELRAALEPLLAGHDGKTLCEELLRAGVPAGAVLNVAEVMAHPHTRQRGMLAELPGYRGTGIPVKLSRTPGSVRRTPPAFAADAVEVLSDAGYSEQDIAALIDSGIVPTTRRSG